MPSPFMPCEDLFDWWTLRCGVWLVFLLALLGNGVVVVVLVFGRSKLDVPRFLVCNLAMADFFMGIYLGMLAVVDAATLGEFKLYGLPWQMSWACEFAGFLGVLSSELSVYTLAVITMERNYAITHAMHLNKRLSLKHASYIMSIGWTFASVMALLPLIGVSDYRKFAVCLPFEVNDVLSMSYVVSLMVFNGFAFLILMGCYLRMYCAIRGSQAWNSNDSRIAKRMALLVFTDFLCWAPIAFFALTAISGLELISLSHAKIFTVFILPLNSCANPFLYAIFTKQFKKECVMLCKRIEESRVTRGIGRCRHSSNFSNRHTPLNTNSAVEKRSGSECQAPLCQCGLSTPKVNVDVERLVQKPSKIKQIAFRWFWKKKGEGERHDSTDSTSCPSNQDQPAGHAHKRGSSISSENFSSRSDSWRHGQVPLRLLESKRALSLQRRRSSWAASSSTSTMRVSTTRSSVSSDSSAAKTLVHHSKMSRGINKQQQQQEKSRNLRGRGSLPNQFLCPDCSKKEVLKRDASKEKDFEKKFHQFFNKLSESSQDEASESKEEQIILSSGESNKPETAETSLQDSIGTDSQTESASRTALDVRHVQKPCCTMETHIENDPETDKSAWCLGNSSSRASSNVSIRTQIPAATEPKGYEREAEVSTHSLTSVCSNFSGRSKKLVKRRKVASDNSLKASLRSIPAMFKSLSSQSSGDIVDHHKKPRRKHYGHYHYSTGDVYLFKGSEAKMCSSDRVDGVPRTEFGAPVRSSPNCGVESENEAEYNSETSCENHETDSKYGLNPSEEEGLV